MHTTRCVPLLAWLVTCLPACGSEFTEDTEKAQQAVIGGEESPPERDNVVLARSGRICTATLVAPGLMLTARHCVSYFDDGTYACSADGTIDERQPRSPSNAGTIGATLPPEEISFYVGQLIEPDDLDYPTATAVRVFAPATDTICRNDIALVQIEPEIDLPVYPLRLYEGVHRGDPMLVVGYGQNGTSAIDRDEREVEVTAVGQSDFYPVAGQATLRAFTVGQSVCPGDSGGPAITDRGAVAGVFSLINFDCMSSQATNTYTQVAAYASFVEDAFEQAGYEPVLEEPVGEGGAGGADGEASGGSGGAETATGGATSAGSGGSATGGSGGKSDPPTKKSDGACHCRAGARPQSFSAWFAVALLLGAAFARRPGKKRHGQA